MSSGQLRSAAFYGGLIALIGLRLFLTSDLSTQINYAPHDDSLYVARAYHLLRGEAFGTYNALILIKYPGLSFWLAATRSLGIPFLLSVNALYIGSGLYLSQAFLRGGVNRWVVLVSFAFFLFNPITFGNEWVRVLREPLGTGLLVLIAGAIAHIFIGTAHGRPQWLHLWVFALAFAFSLFLREDDKLLYALLLFFVVGLFWQITRRRPVSGAMWIFVGTTFLLPIALGKLHEHALRGFVERHYGLPIVHEFSEGEFPRMMAAIRSIRVVKDNRLVMVSQEALTKLNDEVPSFRPVIERLPKPGVGTTECQLQGVCTEMGGWALFQIKEESFRAGMTPTLAAGQKYFGQVRSEIEAACTQGRLTCIEKGQGLLPPMELRWTRAYVFEGWRLLRIALAPDNARIGAVPVVFDVPIDLGRIYQMITMADYYDTQLQSSFGVHPRTRLYANPSDFLREAVIGPYQLIGAWLIVAAFAALIARIFMSKQETVKPITLAFCVIGFYLLFRLAALSYVSVFLGLFTGRMMFATYALAIICSLPVLAEVLEVLRRTWWSKKYESQ